MTRVTENSNSAALRFALNKAKSKLENLQMQGSTLRAISKPSDNPINNIEALTLKASRSDNTQFDKNIDHAKLQLNTTELALEGLTDIMVKAKEVAIGQASDLYNGDVRKNVANEIIQLRNQALAISNKRLGNRYIFAGFKSLSAPFNRDGTYNGDEGTTNVEIAKDFFIPVNLTGSSVFYINSNEKDSQEHPLTEFSNELAQTKTLGIQQENSRSIASVDSEEEFQNRENMFSLLDSLTTALQTNDSDTIKGLLEKFDTITSKLITLRTKVGSISNSITVTKGQIETDNLNIEERKSKLLDADIAELFSDIVKQQDILTTTYKSGSSLMNKKLLDFLR